MAVLSKGLCLLLGLGLVVVGWRTQTHHQEKWHRLGTICLGLMLLAIGAFGLLGIYQLGQFLESLPTRPVNQILVDNRPLPKELEARFLEQLSRGQVTSKGSSRESYRLTLELEARRVEGTIYRHSDGIVVVMGQGAQKVWLESLPLPPY